VALVRPKVALVGDSLTNEGDFRPLHYFADTSVFGINGETSFGVFSRIHEYLQDLPDYLFLNIGVNDLAQGERVESLSERIKRIWEKVVQLSPGTRVVATTILPISHKLFENRPPGLSNKHIGVLNGVLRQSAFAFGADMIDLNAAYLNDDYELDPEDTYDGIHLKKKAYFPWVALIISYLSCEIKKKLTQNR
jgi:lysophospholipase L1-like esterase